MAPKKANALKRQQYGTPLPLPCLQNQNQIHEIQHQHQIHHQSQDQCLLTTQTPVVPAPHSSWTPLDALLEGLHSISAWRHFFHPKDPAQSLHLIQAEFHPQGESVWVKQEKDMETLFRQGFFGKGILSRSEATWKQRNTAGVQQDGMTLEEITRQRRIERAQLKKEKMLILQLDQSNLCAPASSSSTSPASPSSITSVSTTLQSLTTSDNNQAPITKTEAIANAKDAGQVFRPSILENASSEGISGSNSTTATKEENYEHLQLSLEEAFFLVFAVECISVKAAAAAISASSITKPLSIQECWLQFAEASTLKQHLHLLTALPPPPPPPPPPALSSDNPFIVRYVAYHYYRSQGWIVKDGLKYGTDFLLYQKGLVFGHSQYAVRIIPCESEEDINPHIDPLPKTSRTYPVSTAQSFISPAPGQCQPHAALSWQWLLTLNRVVAQVQKTVILCYVVMPTHITMRQLSHPRTALPLYKVAEVGIKRFIPEKNRA